MAKSQSLNIVIGADISNLKKGFDAAVVAVQKSGKMLTEDAGKSVASIQAQFDKLATGKLTGRTVQQLTNLAMEVRALGPEFATTANSMIKEAGKIKDSIGDTRAEVSYFASDTRRLDAVLGGIQGVAGAFGAVEGAAAALGIQNEDLQQTMVKLQGIMALVNGLQAVQNALQAESAVMIGIQTAATKVQTFVMGQATLAARAYSAALLATGAGAVLVAIGLAVSLFKNMSSEIDKAKARLESFQKAQERSLTLGQRQIKEEERRAQLAISQAQAQGKSEAEIFKIKQDSLDRQKAMYIKYGKEAMDQLHKQRREELYLATGNAAKIAEIRIKYEQLENDLRYSINNEYKDKVVALEVEKNGEIANQRQADFKDFELKQAEKLKAAQKAANDLKATEIASSASGTRQGIKAVEPAPVKIPDPKPIEHAYAQIDYAAQRAAANQEAYEERFAKSAEGINAAFNSLTAQGLEAFGELIGGVLTGQIDSFETFGKKLLGAVAAFMKSFGQALIATATASKAFKELLIKQPVAAIAAGVALVAGSAVITGMLNKGPNVTAFADGGIVSGPTLGLMGEYPGASTNPEVIAPLVKLKSLMKPSDSGSGYIASTMVSGRDLAIVLNRYNKDNQRG
jgi:hypothetical protein